MYLPQILSPENRIQICLVQKTDLLFLSPENLKSPAWNTGQKNSEKSPQSMFKTRLDTFENDFGHFWNFENFLICLQFFENPTLHETRGTFFSKKLPQNTFGHLETFLDIFGTLKLFWFFSLIFV